MAPPGRRLRAVSSLGSMPVLEWMSVAERRSAAVMCVGEMCSNRGREPGGKVV